jgi:hypothetical protein
MVWEWDRPLAHFLSYRHPFPIPHWSVQSTWTPIKPAIFSRNAHSSTWRWRQCATLKRRSTSMWLHGSTSQKTLNFTLTAVRTWNLTCKKFVVQNYQYWMLSKFVQQFRWRKKRRNTDNTNSPILRSFYAMPANNGCKHALKNFHAW